MIKQTSYALRTLALAALFYLTSVAAAVSNPLVAGAVLRVAIFHGDGYGDVHNAVALARLLTAQFPAGDFAVVVEDDRAYDGSVALNEVPEADPDARRVQGITVLRGNTASAREAIAAHALQIVFLPAGNERTKMVWGTARYNLYVEEPGAPLSEVAYVTLPRGTRLDRADGTRHLRMNPGFSRDSYGVAPPLQNLAPKSASRQDLLAHLRHREIGVDDTMAVATWGSAYNHAQYGNDAHTYLEAIAFALYFGTLRENVVVFDFGAGQSSRAYLDILMNERRLFWWREIPLQLIGATRPPEPWVGTRAKRSLTIVKVGSVPHEIYQSFVGAADLPIAVTGTQSLIEAITRDLAYVHEFLAWKMDLNFGVAEVAMQNFFADEREFLIDWICGEGDRIHTQSDLNRSRTEFLTAPLGRDERQIRRHRRVVIELMTSAERQALVRRLNALLRARFNLAPNVVECARRLAE